jgi:hypothetical protein
MGKLVRRRSLMTTRAFSELRGNMPKHLHSVQEITFG